MIGGEACSIQVAEREARLFEVAQDQGAASHQDVARGEVAVGQSRARCRHQAGFQRARHDGADPLELPLGQWPGFGVEM